jgi:imidazolonepropionase-like amidohydrolase
MRALTITAFFLFFSLVLFSQGRYYIKADRVFDGQDIHTGWAVIVEGNKIVAAGPGLKVPEGATEISYPNSTLTPGLIE